MKPRNPFQFLRAGSIVAAVTIVVSLGSARAANQTWISLTGPTADWNTTDLNWDAGVAWTQNNHAIFGGSGEVVTLTDGISAGGLTFSADGYTVTGNTLTLTGATPTIGTDSEVIATINSAITGTAGMVKSGVGSLILGGAATDIAGGMTLSQGTLQSNNIAALGTGTVTLGDANTGEENVMLFYTAQNSSATHVNVAANGTGDTIIKWSQDVWGTSGKGYNTYNDWMLTLNRMVTFQCTGGGKQIAPWVTGSGTAAGEVAVTANGGQQVTWTSAMNAANTAVQVNDFTGNVWITGSTKLQAQNRSYQSNTSPYYNGLIPDAATVIIDAGSTLQLHHGAETIGFLSGDGTVAVGTGTGGNQLTIAGDATTPSTGPATLGTATFSGTFATNQSALVKTGTGTQELAGGGITFTAGVTLTNGTLKLTDTTAWNSNIALDAANPTVLQLNSGLPGDAWTFGKQLTGGSTAATLLKGGEGAVTLAPTGGNPTVGTLAVAGGKLSLNTTGAFFAAPAPTTTVATGAALAGKANLGATTVADAGSLTGGFGGSGTLTLDSLTFTGTATLSGAPSATAAPIVVTNALSTGGGTDSVTVNLTSVPGTNGTYHLVQFGSQTGTLTDFKLPNAPRAVFLQANPGFIDVVVDTTNQPVWTGLGDQVWSTANQFPRNWKLSSSGSATDFQSQDIVTFDDGATVTDVYVDDTDVDPLGMVFANDTKDYLLDGIMDITSGSLTKTGAGTLTINQTFTFGGGSTLAGGVVSIFDETCLGTGNRTFNGGTLEYTDFDATWTRETIINGGGGTIAIPEFVTVTHTGILSGSGVLTKTGAGALKLTQNSGTFVTPIQISEGWLNLDYGGGNVTYAGNITGTTGGLSLLGTGASATTGLTLTGNNIFSGETHIYGRRIFLDSPTGNAIGGDIVVKNGNWAYHCLTLNRDEQIADTAVLRFEQTNTAYDFRLNGHTETLAGIQSLGSGQSGGSFCIIENAGYDGGNDSNIPAGSLIVSGSGTYLYHGSLRNQNGGSNNGALSFTKSGTGTQTLSGNGISYTGTTTVNSGVLKLANSTSFASSGVTLTGGTFEVNTSTVGAGVPITAKTGATLAGNATTINGTVTIEAGAKVAPGIDGGIGILTVASGTMAGNYACQIDGAVADRMDVTGALAITAGTITITTVNAPTATEYIIATYGAGSTGDPAITGTPAGYTVDTATPGVIKLVKTGGGYDSWAAANAPGQTMDQDHDNDGVSNGIEYFMGLSGSGFTANPAIATGGAISWPKGAGYTGTYGTDYVIQTSGDLVHWDPVPQGNVTIDADSVDYTLPKTNPKGFTRLKVTGP